TASTTTTANTSTHGACSFSRPVNALARTRCGVSSAIANASGTSLTSCGNVLGRNGRVAMRASDQPFAAVQIAELGVVQFRVKQEHSTPCFHLLVPFVPFGRAGDRDPVLAGA